MGRTIALVYGAISYLLFFATFLYSIGFVGNQVVPKAIDSGVSGNIFDAIVLNVALLSIFAVQHSIMARPGFKAWWTRIISKAVERSTFVLLTSLILALIFWKWQPMGDIVWSVENQIGVIALWTIFGIGWLVVLVSTFMINHFDLFGLTQVYDNFKGRESSPPKFMVLGLYKVVRHPIMLGFIIAFWATPVMTMGHLLFAAVTTAYILLSLSLLEERDLVAELGDAYTDYQSRVPMIFPTGSKK
ncbi:MAG: isoprenylcysteine carboxylmethyltransferase family protein [Rhodospirillales bacterium]|jgi:methanethiol S-methyltransferase|nr:isoprenylcysteine carboxylmethyltransferase family protein [Rhodospirillales bacterium]MBT5075629.1 isoprenylcysteine carboxylmethyltransferase family protein [Rhodospirillales bacterium]MBT5672824.1 isoprenylcysteine carboxylmethyltransferase family protein [Rhodospirillales bacterium]MBT6187501.1 isoprenylcysteine carboxylmethyltransferase family protein [Rhodospirillales bacterium]MBT6743439.1 isoprenylcysteine carboxylmethyltransferase family protein [Rhodospirillales bacterium]